MDGRNSTTDSQPLTFLRKHFIVSVIVSVAVAAVAFFWTVNSPFRSKPTAQTPILSSLPRSLVQADADLKDYDFALRMDPQVQDCSSDTHWKKTFPDLDYSLLGYDIIYGYPLANGRDPGSRHPIFMADYSKPKQTSDCRFVVPDGFIIVPSESCVVSFESKLVRNKQEMTEHLGVQANVEGGGWGFQFSASASYKRDTSEMSTGEFLFVMSHAMCQNYYSIIDFTNPPPFDPGFLAWAKKLADPNITEEAVLDFIKYYGTHFFTDVTFGAKFVQRHKVSQTSYESLKKVGISVEAQASYSGMFSIGGGFSLSKEQQDAASNFSKAVETTTFTVGSTPPSNGDAMTWAASVQQNPVPMLYSLSSIANLFTEQFAKNMPGVNYDAIKDKLKDVAQKYCEAMKKEGSVHSCESNFYLEAPDADISGRGYKYLRELDKDLCVSFCLQDPNCTAVTYSVRSPQNGQNASLCKFYTSLGEGVYLNLTKPVPNVDSRTILFISKLQDVHLYHAKLEGIPYSETKTDQGSCTTNCREDFFCDAYNFAYTGICSMYSSSNIKNIVVDNNSEVSFLEHKSHDNPMPPI